MRTNIFEKLIRLERELSAKRLADSGGADDAPIICHYTDPKGLIGILSHGQLWATDVS